MSERLSAISSTVSGQVGLQLVALEVTGIKQSTNLAGSSTLSKNQSPTAYKSKNRLKFVGLLSTDENTCCMVWSPTRMLFHPIWK